ncbi:helix-turn-helix domain-containing protein [Roseivivax isoporae]|uniref:Resolvase HTH domain-containing protein n=1 Tax=Roseivivax isoporae LMG 25204 TaxID=1449351 RepID=X7F1F4_9RHOB|nr:helix-turn-helix domain-containing protein [Roseivivax isoporae]ETX26553.1 hypothetical protein RISW2_22880 [Roseivivax isoporae LMG 25204]
MKQIDDVLILRLHRAKMPIEQIARAAGCSRMTVYKRLDSLGAPRRRNVMEPADVPGGGVRVAHNLKVSDADLVAATAAGETTSETAARLGVNVKTIRNRQLALSRRRAAAAKLDRAPQEPPSPPPPPSIGNIPAARVAALVETGGRYRELAALAERWGESTTRVQSWYHRARAAA